MCDQIKPLARALPQHLAAPAQAAPDKFRGKAIADKPRHCDVPAMQEREDAAVARCAVDIADAGVPVVSFLIDETEPQPHRISERNSGNTAGMHCAAIVDAVGGEGVRRLRVCFAAPTAIHCGIAAVLRRVSGIELRGHELEGRWRQSSFKCTARRVDQKNIMPFIDARSRPQDLSNNRSDQSSYGNEPCRAAPGQCAATNTDGTDDENRVANKIVDRQPEHRDHEHKHTELAPGVVGVSLANTVVVDRGTCRPLGVLPSTLWGGVGGSEMRAQSLPNSPPSSPTLSHRKSGLPNLRTVMRNRGKPRLRGRGSRGSLLLVLSPPQRDGAPNAALV